jgi:hypothetical protein
MGYGPHATGSAMTEEQLLDSLAEARGEDRKSISDHFHALPQAERYNQLGSLVLQQIRRDPAAALRHRLEAGLDFLLGGEWVKERQLWHEPSETTEGTPEWFGRLAPALFCGSLLIMFGLGLLGWRWTFLRRTETTPASLAFLWIPLPYLLSHAEAYSGPRLPLDGVLLCYAAFAVACLVPYGGNPLFLRPDRERS